MENATHLSSEIVNIVTSEIGTESVKVDQAVSIGCQQMVDFQAIWPEGINETIRRKIVTMKLVSLILNLST